MDTDRLSHEVRKAGCNFSFYTDAILMEGGVQCGITKIVITVDAILMEGWKLPSWDGKDHCAREATRYMQHIKAMTIVNTKPSKSIIIITSCG